MRNEQIERYLLDLLMRLSAEEGEEILDSLLPADQGGNGVELPFERRPAGDSRRILRENERLEIGLDVEAVLIELQEMKLLSPETAEKFLEKIGETGCGSFDSEEAIRLVSTLLRAEGGRGFPGGNLMIDGLVGDMTAH